ncbi:helix-turn-helix transcriptional regulator [Leifsonia shinshuensis]|uniref:helix-turn-helix domain-containing protein n=1 Tax=Leifsonia shinshuensis TaxID=150026 RepID=UPI00285A9D36|nr:helix-turn-helix transcriptional regulator [Leifsonia shinshuensis]MDR6972670.1 transcriptional regulator with XRE-family HTH domain [Leifsonia shinshuensis]
MLLRHAIGSVLRRIRTEQGTTLRELSASSRVSVPYLSEIERGRKEASSEILAALCRVLGVSEGELLTRVAAEFGVGQVLSLVPEHAAERPLVTTTELAPAAAAAAGNQPPVVALAA